MVLIIKLKLLPTSANVTKISDELTSDLLISKMFK